ncbi:MAG: hypothetical protein JRG91_09465 [Deltaproteobacteria bacterium]|nr:hypothetical protein [Deltaproteobacteria bacterium]
MSRGALLALAACAVAVSCHGRLSSERYLAGEEVVVRDFERKVQIHGTALMPAGRGGLLSIWSDDEGVWTMMVTREGYPLRDAVRVSRHGSALISAVHLGKACVADGMGFALAIVPRVTVTQGNAPLEVMLLGLDGRRMQTVVLDAKVGPYSKRVSVVGDCSGVLVGWHQGSIGDFSSRLAFIDVPAGKVRWETRLSDEGVNGFCPGLSMNDGRIVAAWGEVRTAFAHPDEKPRPDAIMSAVLDPEGGLLSGPRRVLETFHTSSTPVLASNGNRIAMLFKDEPPDEYKEGVYLAFLDPEGGLVGEPARIGRGDGPDPPILLTLPGDHMLTAVVRSLAFELLVGVNSLDARGEKTSGELQIYAHQVRFRHLSAFEWDGKISLLHVEQGRTRTRLLLTTLHASSR